MLKIWHQGQVSQRKEDGGPVAPRGGTAETRTPLLDGVPITDAFNHARLTVVSSPTLD